MPHPPQPDSSSGPPAEQPSVDELEQELTRVKAELAEYQELIEELPSIYEGKFRHQLGDVAHDIRRLLDEQQTLQDQIRHALAAGTAQQALSAAPADVEQGSSPAASGADPSVVRSSGVIVALRRLLAVPAAHAMAPSRPRLILLVAITTLLVAGLVASLGLWRRFRVPRLATPAVPPAAPQATSPTPAAASKPESQPADEPRLRLRFNGECWLEVQSLDGETVLLNTFQDGDERTVPLGSGLRLRAGRPDLLEVAVGDADFRTIGSIDRIDWVVIRPPAAPEGPS